MGKTGRPKGNNNKECICSIRMDKPTIKRLEVYCEKMGILKSQAIREAINILTLDENTKH